MKLALVVPGGVDRSGERRVIPALVDLLRHLGTRHDVHVFALVQEPLPGRWSLAGATVHNIGARRRRWRAFRAVCAEHRRAPFDRIQAIWSGACGQVAVAAGQWLRVPVGVHVAGGELVRLRDIGYGGRLRWHGRCAEWLTLRAATEVTAASEPLLRQIAALGVRARRTPLGIDRERWPLRPPAPRRPGEALRCIHIASLNAVKDPRTLLRAAALMKAAGVNFRLDIIGEDTLGGRMQRRAARLGLRDRVVFHGFLTQSQLRPLLSHAHLLLVSSRHEAGPIVVLEAAAVGVPTVGTVVGHVAEWAPEAALASPVGDARALARAVMALANDEGARLRLAAAAQRRLLHELQDDLASHLHERLAALSGLRGVADAG